MRLQSLRSSLDCWLRLVVAIALSVAGCLVPCALPSGASAPASAHAYTYDDIEQLSLRTHVWLVRAVPASTGFRTLPATSGLRPSLDVDTGSAAEGETFVQSAGSSKLLGQNLEASGVARPAETAAHHIVAGGAEAAAPARGVLTQYGIDVNTAENGVFLPSNTGSLNPFGAAVHSTLHTGSYYESVNELLLGATSRSEVMDSLAFLREGLLGGGL